MVWSEAECHDTGEQELKEPQDEYQKRVIQASGLPAIPAGRKSGRRAKKMVPKER
jgi:hypothetical protein